MSVLALVAACSEAPQGLLNSTILRGDVAAIEKLLDDPRVDVNWHTPKTGSALGVAAAYAQPNQGAIVRLLLRRGANPNIATDENMTPLHSAAYHGYADIVKVLIDAGAEVNTAESRYGFTPLAYAARSGSVEVIKLLIDAGADRAIQVENGRTPIAVAGQYGNLEAVNTLTFYQPTRRE